MGFSYLLCNASLILNWNFEAAESKGGEIRDTKTLNSRHIVLLQVLVDVSRFSPGVINLTKKRVEEMQGADWLISQGTSKFVARQVVSLMKNE